MPALSPSQETTWRTRHEVRQYVYISRPATVFAARIDMASVSYPLTSITFDTVTTGTYTDIEPGMTLLLGSSAGASDYGIQRVRSAATSSTIPVGRTSQGTRVGELTIVNDAYITVLNERRVWSKIPYIAQNGTQYKDELTFSSSTSQPPVANAGVDYADTVDPNTGVITVDFDGSASYAVANGATISTYAWDFADGTPSTASSATVSDVTFPAGERYVKLTVTDSSGNSHSAYQWVVAVDPESVYNWIPVELSEHINNRDGATFSFTVKGSALSRSTYPEGTRVICIWKEKYNGTSSTVSGITGREYTRFTGWLAQEVQRINPENNGVKKQVTFRCQDIGERLKTLPVFSQRIDRDNSPNNWYDLAYANIDRYIHYLLHWHSTALDVADFVPSNTGNTYAIPSLETDGGNFFDQVDRLAQAIGYKLTVNSAGQLRMRGDPIILPTSAQASAYSLPTQRTSTTVTTLTAADYGEVEFSSAEPPRYHWNWGEAVLVNASSKKQSSVFCYAPGATPGQGLSSNTQGEQLVTGQDELNVREGHRYAARLNPTQVNHRIALAHGGWLFEPADMEWVKITIPAGVTPQRGVTYSAENFLPTRVTRRFDPLKSKVSVSIDLEREVQGAEAQTYTPPKVETQDFPAYTVPTIQFPTPVLPVLPPSVPVGVINLALFAFSEGGVTGRLIITRDFDSASPTWVVKSFASLGMDGAFSSFVIDPFSPLYLGTGTQVNGRLASSTTLYKVEDVFGTPVLTAQHTFATAIGSSNSSHRFLQASRGTQNWFMCISQDVGSGIGTNITYTTDGSTWTESTITPYTTNNAFINLPTLVMSERTAGTAVAGAYSADNVGAFYKTTDYGATWAVQGSPSDFGVVSGGWLYIPYGDTTFSRLYYGQNTSTSNRNFKVSTSGTALVSDYAPRTRRCVHACDTYPNRVAALLTSELSGTVRQLYTAADGLTFTLKQTSMGDYHGVYVGSNNPDLLIIWGDAKISISTDFGTTLVDKTGNLASVTNARIENICGG